MTFTIFWGGEISFKIVLHSVENFPVHFGKTSWDDKGFTRNFYKRSFCSIGSKTWFESFILGNSLSTVWLQMIHRHNGICFCFTVLHIKWSHQDTMDYALWPKTNPQSFTFCLPEPYSSQRVSIHKRESEEPTGRTLLTKGWHTYITNWQDAVFARLDSFVPLESA